MSSECRGLGRTIEPAKASKLAERLVERNITELNEAISLLEKYHDFERGPPRKRGPCIVHDSEGEHQIRRERWCANELRSSPRPRSCR